MQNKDCPKLLNCPFCGGEAFIEVIPPHKHVIATFVADYDGGAFVECTKCSCAISAENEQDAINKWNSRIPKERGADKPKITCLNCKHLMFSDMYGECNKQLKIVNPSDTCEYAEPKERGGWQ